MKGNNNLVDMYNVRCLGNAVIGVIIFLGSIAMYIFDKRGAIHVDDDPKKALLGTILIGLFGLFWATVNWLSAREPKGKYRFTNNNLNRISKGRGRPSENG